MTVTPSPNRPYRRRTVPQGRPNRTAASDKNSELSSSVKGEQQVKEKSSLDSVTRLPQLTIPLHLERLWVAQMSTSVLVDHLLYAKGLFPLTVSELLSLPLDASSDSRNFSMDKAPLLASSSKRRKLQQARTQLRQLVDSWTCAWSSELIQHATHVLITIGPSLARGKEFLLLDLMGLQTPNPSESDSGKFPPLAALARRLLPRVVEGDANDNGLSTNAASSMKLFVSVCVRNEALEEYWKKLNAETRIPSIEQSANISSWIPRTGRVLPKAEDLLPNKGRRPRRRLVVLSITHRGQERSDNEFSSLFEDERHCHWLSLSQSIKGFRF